MTSHTGRLYALALALVVFFLAWAVVATHPWATANRDPRLQTLAAREAQLRREAALVQKVVSRRWATYRAELQARKTAIAAAKARNAQLASLATAGTGTPSPSPAVQVVTLPPLTITRTS
jgi:multidrug efflux pump subunit AcrA (membrane-fusion protein)